jgi:hypothetical protein
MYSAVVKVDKICVSVASALGVCEGSLGVLKVKIEVCVEHWVGVF